LAEQVGYALVDAGQAAKCLSVYYCDDEVLRVLRGRESIEKNQAVLVAIRDAVREITKEL